MTALMIVLVAAMAVGNDGTERVSTETEERLAVEDWEGVMTYGATNNRISVKFQPGWLIVLPGPLGFPCTWVDEGGGNCRCHIVSPLGRNQIQYCIYKRVEGQLVICSGHSGHGRPTRFRADGSQDLFILKHARTPGK